MNNTEDDRHFHLERIRENEGIVRTVPVRVDTEGVDSAGADGRDRSFSIFWPIPAILPDVERLGKDIVVDETGKDRECTHEQDKVSSTVLVSANPYMNTAIYTYKKKVSTFSLTPAPAIFFSKTHMARAERNMMTP